MNPHTLVIADIHLHPEPYHPINRHFTLFLDSMASHADRLYILGDLFEAWVGDDIGLEQYASVIEQLKMLSDSGVKIYLQYGNRDFLMGKSFWLATGIQPLEEIHLAELYSHRYLMLHGDQLCTDDHQYQKMRRWFRNRFVQWVFLNLSKKKRIEIGKKMRRQSQEASSRKDQAIMDVNREAVRQLFALHPECPTMIHGHTHRPDRHLLELNGRKAERWVLGDWKNDEPYAIIFRLDQEGIQRIALCEVLLHKAAQ
ncbi:UDP-2,3-diacylglucosamine diphosphatase [Thiomicrorhabdus sp.]|uniref:UDP-2,3-diacylglucosamine diphosphatase n=1 Tax=Thiomicrorhabdus sp. TaxID=2039724 RepID=UPI0029C686CC|nr:UDP-2,3-diacylglucosamine diphosphatase [Thiomicrorhabdus sp.]